MAPNDYPSDEVVLDQFKDHVRETFMQQALETRKQYVTEIGNLLSDNRILFEKVLQNQVEIRELLQKGWGY